MMDSSDTSLANVKSSYDDVNNALENLLGNVSGNSNYATVDALTALQNQVNNMSVGTNPVGSVIAFTTNTIPNGYLLCNGASFDTSKYSQLYSALGTASVPDMRGLFLRGLDTTGSVDNYGSTRVLLTTEEGTYALATTRAGAWSSTPSSTSASGLKMDFPYSTSNILANMGMYSAQDASIPPFTATTQSNMGWDKYYGITRPKNIAVNYIIKAVA